MRRSTLAKHLVDAATARERDRILRENSRLADARLADEIRRICYASWAAEPAKARRAAAAIGALERIDRSEYVRAIGSWVRGISSITKGRFEESVISLTDGERVLRKLGRDTDAARASVALLLALAMLGRYDDAIDAGRNALAVFVRNGDHLAAGKIEMNISNIVSRQSRHGDARKFCASARRRFIKAGEKAWQAMAENGLANTYAELNDFKRAESYFKSALETARRQRMTVTEAEIEASLGNLAILRGDHSAALAFLETSRQRYAGLGMPHQSAIAELEIADIYSELNLAAEAIELYRRSAAVFSRLRLRSEEARARLNLGRTLTNTNEFPSASRELARAERLFELEGNRSGTIAALLSIAELERSRGRPTKAKEALDRAERSVSKDENPRNRIKLELITGIIELGLGDLAAAETRLGLALDLAKKRRDPEAAHRAQTWLGRAADARGNAASARRYFQQAIATVESLRQGLSGDEFSMSYFSSRLDAYGDLARLCIAENKYADAFEVFERGRSRTLLDRETGGRRLNKPASRIGRLAAEARAELNALYKRSETAATDDRAKLNKDIARLEKQLAERDRQVNSLSAVGPPRSTDPKTFALADVQARLGDRATLIEFVRVDGKLSAFVITSASIDLVPLAASEGEITGILENLHFQFDTIRYGSANVGRFAAQLKARADKYLASLYDVLFRPLERYVRGDRIVVVPAGAVHYVPVAALFDGERYLIDRFEICHAPSAAVWLRLSQNAFIPIRKPLLVGYADERIPLVGREIAAIRRVLPSATVLTSRNATFAAFSAAAGSHDMLHLACHGQFRPDNPMFSSLHLADGWVTVRDLCSQRINAALVTLSACETGISRIFPGDEVLGIVRGFLSAGATAVIVSLWTVNDQAATRLMPGLYRHLQRGDAPAASLRKAQLAMIERGEHPFLWAPFVYIGRSEKV